MDEFKAILSREHKECVDKFTGLYGDTLTGGNLTRKTELEDATHRAKAAIDEKYMLDVADLAAKLQDCKRAQEYTFLSKNAAACYKRVLMDEDLQECQKSGDEDRALPEHG